MDGIHGTNGIIAPLIGAPKMEFGEFQMRGLLEQVKKAVSANGGQMPIADPAGLLSMGVLLEKLVKIEERLAALEQARPTISTAFS